MACAGGGAVKVARPGSRVCAWEGVCWEGCQGVSEWTWAILSGSRSDRLWEELATWASLHPGAENEKAPLALCRTPGGLGTAVGSPTPGTFEPPIGQLHSRIPALDPVCTLCWQY